MADSPQPAVPLASAAFVETNLRCAFCGYNLRTLGLAAVCPECGRPVQDSIRHGSLGYADPGWLRKLRTGVTIPLWTILAGVVLYVVLIVWVISVTVPAAASGASQPPDMTALMPVMAVFGLGIGIATLVSIWLLTTPEPVPGGGLQTSTLATWIRWLTGVSYGVGTVIMVGMWVLSPARFGAPPFGFGETDTLFGILYIVVSVINGAVYSASFLLLLIHLRRLARRHYRKGLGRLMTFLIWGSVAFGGIWIVFIIGILSTAASMGGSFVTTTAPAPFKFTMTSPAPPALTTSARSAAVPVLDASEASEAEAPIHDETAEPVESESGSPDAGASPGLPAATALTPTTMPVGGPPPFFGLGIAAFMFGACLIEALVFAWFVGGIVALFWFRAVFSRALRENIHSAAAAA